MKMRKEIVILALSLQFGKIEELELTDLNIHPELHCSWKELFWLAKQGFLFLRRQKEISEPKSSNFLLKKQRLESIYSACCVAFMSLWRTCLEGWKMVRNQKNNYRIHKKNKMTINFKLLLLHMVYEKENNSWVKN